MSRLPPSFYARPTLDVVQDIIGKVLVHTVRGRRTSGVIVEAEAYIGEDDPACHAAPGPTKRNAPLYGPPGRAYVYLNYGLHYLVNAVTESEGCPAAVLIRALEPLEGLDLMARRRARRNGGRPSARSGAEAQKLSCQGPGNLTVAMAIDLRQNTADLTSSSLAIEDHRIVAPALDWSSRVGIRVGTDRLWRCAWAGHPSVSGRAPRRARAGLSAQLSTGL
jgi:DNA-3-methyladenine glycosylase